jgi:nucleoside-diphosphate-sugar epimerase
MSVRNPATTPASTSTALTPRPEDVVLVTGVGGLVGERLIRHLLEMSPRTRVLVVVDDVTAGAARSLCERLPATRRRRLELLAGSVRDIDLGLTGQEFRRVSQSVTIIHHVAEAPVSEGRRATLERMNIDGTRSVVELAYECVHLQRLVHWSTALVAGQRQGVIMEDELERGQPFFNGYEETKLRAEKIAHAAARRLPVTVLRPGIPCVDARTGDVDPLHPVGQLLSALARAVHGGPIPKWARLDSPFHLVPVDHVVEAAAYLSHHPEAVGMTCHLTDPAPLALHRFALTLQRCAARGAAHQGIVESPPPSASRRPAAMRLLPGHPHAPFSPRALRTVLAWATRASWFNTRNAARLLRTTDFIAPAPESYADRLLRETMAGPRGSNPPLGDYETSDPLD